MFSSEDIKQLQSLGIEQSVAEQQIGNFKKGFPFLKTTAPANAGKGIVQLKDDKVKAYISRFDKFEGTLLKFTPASGAASRMFKNLFEAKEAMENAIPIDWNSKNMKPVKKFFENLRKFAFYPSLQNVLLERGINIDTIGEDKWLDTLKALLDEDGLNYGSLPKGLLLFHCYAESPRTAIEEHLVEAALYAKDKSGNARLHFTVSPEHKLLFESLIQSVKSKYEVRFGVTFNISFSEQKKSTDTLAVDENNEPFRNNDGSMLLRPGGHGALIENLGEQKADIVFIKNIDNVVPDAYKIDTIKYKKALAGILLEIQEKIFNFLKMLEDNPNDEVCTRIQYFYEKELCYIFPKDWEGDKVTYLKEKLHRPIRVCGMVKNEGEPGGGPFIAVNPDGSASLQILESSQLDMDDLTTKNHVIHSTHFNPVDLVCSYVDANGEYFDLKKYRDPATGFISIKSKDGRELKAQELPGLWNGAMSDWNTVFVEVPLSTFNPVKTVNDLLRHEHQ